MTHTQLRKHCKEYSVEHIKWKTISFQNTLHFYVTHFYVTQWHTHTHTPIQAHTQIHTHLNYA